MDKYDKSIEYLTLNPEVIIDAWGHPFHNCGGNLFGFASKSGLSYGDNMTQCGCLTQIKSDPSYHVENRPDLEEQIRNDPNIPSSVDQITVESLPHFAKWQRILDKELNRK